MNRDQYESLHKWDPESLIIRASDLQRPDRTLLYGYTCNRDTWHVYLKDGFIHRLEYTARGAVLKHDALSAWEASRLVPDKRVYPESTDLVFARMLKRIVSHIPFLPFQEARYERVKHRTFHGMLAD
jgi:hypothetical protein